MLSLTYYVFFYLVIISLLLIISTALLTVNERALIGDIQSRRGPSKVGYMGIMQPFSDAGKLLAKEGIDVRYIQDRAFWIAAVASFFISGTFWIVIPLGADSIILNMSTTSFVFFNLAILHVFAIVFAGWASNSKYAILGSLRSTAQMVSYELVIGLSISHLFKFVKSLSILQIAEANSTVAVIGEYVAALVVIFFVASLAELNRHPFDLPEAESELVSGYNVEYSSIKFALFFLGEYLNLLYYAVLINDLFTDTASYIYFFRFIIIIALIINIRALIPRYRYDQLMELNWKFFLPVLSSYIFYNTYLITYFA